MALENQGHLLETFQMNASLMEKHWPMTQREHLIVTHNSHLIV